MSARRHSMDGYIQQRKSGGNWEFRRGVPAEIRQALGKREITKSLKTTSYDDALELAQVQFDISDRLFNSAKSAGVHFINLESLPPVTDSTLHMEEADFAVTVVLKIGSFFRSKSEVQLIRFYHNFKSDDFIAEEFERFLQQAHIFLPKTNTNYSHFKGEFRRLMTDKIMNAAAGGRIRELKAIDTPDQFEAKFLKPERVFEKPMPVISELYQEFLKQHPHIRDDREERARFDNVVTCFSDFVGDMPVNYVRKNQTRDFIVEVAKYPIRRDGKSASMTFQDAIKYHAEQGEYGTLAIRTVKVWIAKLKRLYAYAIDTYEDQFDIKNPFVGVDKYAVGRESKEKRNLTEDELKILFADPIFEGERDHLFWSPIVLLHLGCRASEVLNLPLSKVKQDKQGIWYFDVTNGKTDHSIRQIVCHQYLIDVGFIRYVEDLKAKGEKWLFPQFNRSGRMIKSELRPSKDPSAQYSQWFGRFMDKLGLSDPTISLHSLRHSWISTATKTKIPKEFRIAISGHASADIHDEVYTHHELETLKSELDKVRFAGFPYDRIT
jgi:integrase